MTFKTFIARFQFEYLSNVVRDVWKRFPLTMLCLIPACVISMLEAHGVDVLRGEILTRLLMFLSYAAVWFAAEKIFAESRNLSRGGHLLLAFTGALFLALAFFVPREYSALQGFLAGALGLLLLFSPYIGRKSTEDSVWYYNYCNGIAAAVAAVASGVFCLGLCAVVGSMDYLIYEGKLSKTLYADIWLFGAWIFGPVSLLYQVQRKFDFEKNDCFIPKGISFIANYLAVPLVLIYTWVLYAYVLKIGVTMSLPKGNLAYMVTGFGSAGIAVWLAVYPMRDTGTKLLRQFHKYFYYILALPVALLALGLYTRIEQYGVTEERYAIGMALVWLAGLTLYYLFRPRQSHIKHVPMVLCLLCFLAAVGPWSAVSVSTWSQKNRLEALLQKVGVIKADGSLGKVEQPASFEDRKEISSALDYMIDGKRAAIQHLIEPYRAELEKKYMADYNLKEMPKCDSGWYDRCYLYYPYGMVPERLMELWGMEHVNKWQDRESEYYSVNRVNYYNDTDITKVSPYDYMVRVSAYKYNDREWSQEQDYRGQFKVKFTMDDAGVFTATHSDGRKVTFPLSPLFEEFRKEGLKTVPDAQAQRMILRAEEKGFAVEIRLSELRGRNMGKETLTIDNASMLLLFRE